MQNHTKAWWQKPLRVVQTNLQIKDTSLIEPDRFAAQMKQMGANTIVFNVAGIYAWYPSKVPFHTINEYLPHNFDLLKEVIRACHEQGIRFIARFDFSKTEDKFYLQKPQWFIRQPSGEPEIIGAGRPGNWSLLMSTCLNGGYRNEDVAIPVLDEVISNYDIDGIFLMRLVSYPAGVKLARRNTLSCFKSRFQPIKANLIRAGHPPASVTMRAIGTILSKRKILNFR